MFSSQDVPHFCLMLTLLLVSADRHSAIVRGTQLIPMRWAVSLAWALSVGLVLPYSAYIKYIDLSVSESLTRLASSCLQLGKTINALSSTGSHKTTESRF